MASKKKKKKEHKKKSFSFKGFILALFVVVVGIMHLPTTFLLAFGMLPTFVALGVDRDPEKNKSFTIGSMNFAGCFPYLLEIWNQGNTMEMAMSYLMEPMTVIVMYSAAASGYLINWLVTWGIASMMVRRGHSRIQRIEKEKQALEERWGKKVNGNYILDDLGFPVQGDVNEEKKAKETT